MADKSDVQLTVVFGKQSRQVTVCLQDLQALEKLKTTISEHFHLAPKFQRLVLRGRDVNTSAVFTNGCKLLVLRSSAFYEQAAASNTASTSAVSSSPAAQEVALKTGSKASGINVNELAHDVVLVQVFRGKSCYDVICRRSGTIRDVQSKLSAVLGLSSPQALRLLVKGKTPADDIGLETLAGTKKVIKAMALLQAQQHVVQEKEREVRELLNELAGATVALQRVERQMARNFTSRDESLFELSRVLDDGQRISGNLKLVRQHLARSKMVGPRASEQTLAVLMQAIEEANALAKTAQGLLERHSVV